MEDGCSSETQRNCSESGEIYYDTSDKRIFALPGWNIGCSVVETILQSTLECFYDRLWILRKQAVSDVILSFKT
ncbi:hypothetical protein I4U23_028675 [Adineta vaga]|nr:hypothetical protein I4U23_028675 [Adineta vaga]